MGNISFRDFCHKKPKSFVFVWCHFTTLLTLNYHDVSGAFILACRGTHVEGVDLRIRPVDQLLREVAPFHHQHVNLHQQAIRRVLFHLNTK